MHGTVVVDAANEPLRNAVLWPDRRANDELAAFAQLDRDERGARTNPLIPGMAGPIVMWLRSNEPDVWSALRGVLAPKDWLRSRLTGEAPVVTEHSDASATLMYDGRTNSWSGGVQALLGLDVTVLSPISRSDRVAGLVTASASRHLGINEGTPVAVGAGDAAAALLGLGVETPGKVVVNVGTGAQVMTVIDKPDARFLELGLNQFRTAGGAAQWYVMAPVINAGLALSWVRGILGFDWDTLYGHADSALANAHDDPIFLPFLSGERDSAVGLAARGAWRNLAVQHDRAALARSALVGVASYLAVRTLSVLEITGGDRVLLSGGSAESPAWTQLLATLLDCEVELAADSHTSARGAAITAARSQNAVLAPTPLLGRVSPQHALAGEAQLCLTRIRQFVAPRSSA
jgi:xylulokinase